MTAYYSENDPYAAQWLRNLIAAGLIAPGVVDERDMREVEAFELQEFTQCHFFAGIGIWSLALRRAGWADDRPIWTGSCPCQPFSAAGKQKGFKDDRHLWPHWFGLIEQHRPPIVIGEQVASKDGLRWLDLVSADLEGAGYAFGASDLCAAGFGQAHLRQRLYFVGLADAAGSGREPCERNAGICGADSAASKSAVERGSVRTDGGLADTAGSERQGQSAAGSGDISDRQTSGRQQSLGSVASGGTTGSLADTSGSGRSGSGRSGSSEEQRATERGATGGLEYPASRDASAEREQCGGQHGQQPGDQGGSRRTLLHPGQAGSLDDADWLLCRNPAGEPSWRPVESGTQQMVDGIAFGVGVLRTFGWTKGIKEVTNAAFADESCRQSLRALRSIDESSQVWRAFGGRYGFSKAAILLACLCEYSGQLGKVFDLPASGSAEIRQGVLRALQQVGEAARSPQGRKPFEQSYVKLDDALSKLSQTRAFSALEGTNGFPLAKGIEGRVGQLRAYGNGLDLETATGFCSAVLELAEGL